LIAKLTCRVINFGILLDNLPFWIKLIAPLDGWYPSLGFLLDASCCWFDVAPCVGSGGGGGALSARVQGAPANPRFIASFYFEPKASCSLKKVR
jgi:hypothetical protein